MADETNAGKALANGVEIELAGEKRRLKYNLLSLCKLDELTGKNPLEKAMWENVRPKDVATLIWAGLLHEGREETPEQIANQIPFQEIERLPELIKQAFGQAEPPPSEEKKSESQE